LGDFRGGRVLIVFVPWAFSPVCTYEIEQLRDAPELAEAVSALLVINCDSMFVNQEWAQQNSFEGVLLSDFWPHGEVARAYGVFNEERGQARRGSFLIDSHGIVEWVLENPEGDARDLALYRQALGLEAPRLGPS
jgi:alkyl hydroperoxide reductase subunit AhpC